jgi:chromosome partitioning protein
MPAMNIISFVTQKGGTGKSTLALSLAVAAEAKGEKVCVLDLDPQGTSANWYESRSADAPALLSADQVGNLTETLQRLTAAKFTLAIIDTAGVDSHATRGAMQAADLCLIPVRPSEADIKATTATIQALTAMGKSFAFVLNQAPAARRARLTSAVAMRLGTAAQVVPVPIAARMDHQYAYALGQGVTEYAPEGKAAAEVVELLGWCHKQLGGKSHEQTKRRA